MSSSKPYQNPADDDDSGPEIIAEDDVQEVIEEMDGDGDVPMDSDDEGQGEELILENDAIAYFDQHKDSVFAVAQHPVYPNLIATGGSEGEADDAPGKGYVFETSAASSKPVLPPSYNSDPSSAGAWQPTELQPLFAIDGHTDSINALAFTLPRGDFLVSGGMDGRLRVYAVGVPSNGVGAQFKFVGESQETEEVSWVSPCPSAAHPNTVALGASDGSVWVFTIDPASDPSNPIRIVQSYFLHTTACTAGAWSFDGLLLATVSEDSSLHVFDVFGEAAAKNLALDNGQTVVSLADADQRFFVEGGLYSVAISPSGGLVAVGGAQGAIRVVGLPRLSQPASQRQTTQRAVPVQRGPAGRRAAPSQSSSAQSDPSAGAGVVLAALNVQSDSIESLSFSPQQPLLAAGSVDGSVAVFDAARSFAVRKHIRGAHEGESVVKVDFVRAAAGATAGWLLTSCGLDGVVRRWDLRGATATQEAVASGQTAGLVKEWKGHRGGGEGGGVLGFVQGADGERVVTAGDDSVVLVFEA
ncbi:WD40-repeat-containing domain protein [Triangularia verruculosa]|uniref:WD40-repeat-containing domain protein n=1 Tax=Triangularia verruculosa TaxID=2587418 RepID=A0AAN6XG43_9PEZI|nr:WD40-repeat-containing domain protein [Triangularia verruculosa]